MPKARVLLLLFAAALYAAPVIAQQTPVNVGRVYVNVPKPGMANQFEEGRKRHMDWHRKQNDSWTWEMWQVATGDATGAYISITFGHTWKDFDTWDAKYGEADAADAANNMGPYIGTATASVWQLMTEVSRPPESMEPSKMAEAYHYMVKPDHESDFNYALHKFDEAIKKTNWPPHYLIYVLANGGEGPHYVIVLPHNSWADMANPELSFDAMLEKAVGKHEADELTQTFNKSLAHTWSEVLVYRPDLSYRPAGR